MKNVVENNDSENWRVALKESKDPDLIRLYNFSANLNLANWQYLLSLKEFGESIWIVVADWEQLLMR
jgi:hypothetical protein